MITVDNYKEELKGICVIEISGESCANCLSLMPILAGIMKERDDARLVHIEATPETAPLMEHFEVLTAPTILVTLDGEIKARCKGFQPEEILELWLDAKIEEIKAQKK